ncbi:MAG: PhoH family protein, partial [Firmicutes bacterium]|nr:PhoH family protein [Bacillota bacterium]
RLGFASKMVITGDPSQSDLPKGTPSGLNQALTLLQGLEDIQIITFDKIDVVRHPLVQRILERYETSENQSTQSDK